MEESKLFSSNDTPRHRSLTPTRFLRGLLCLLVLLSTALMMLVYLGPFFAVFLRLFNIHYSRKATSFFFGSWLALWPFLFEKINKTKIVFSGETIPPRERALLLANHRTEVDWMYLWDLALRKVQRKWEVDASTMSQKLATFANHQDPLWLAIFPEGTDFNEAKCMRCQKYAIEHGLPILKNVLLPKAKGFYACLEALRSSLDAVYDITIAYKNRCRPSLMDNVFGMDPSEVHIHVRRIPLDQIPASEDKAGLWLVDLFQLKDQFLSDFRVQGHFPKQCTEADISTLKCLVNIAIVTSITGVCIFFTFFSSIWFKIYMALGCVYLASATYFNIQPSPVLSCVGSMFITRKLK